MIPGTVYLTGDNLPNRTRGNLIHVRSHSSVRNDSLVRRETVKLCKVFGSIYCAKPVEMVHFNQHSTQRVAHLLNGGKRSRLDVSNPVLPEAEQCNCLPAKQWRLSRPNNAKEMRRKRSRRNKKLREKPRKESRNAKQCRLKDKIKRQIENKLKVTTQAETYGLRSKAEYYCRKWRQERSLRATTSHV
jgi:hypothetical protein